MGKEYAQAIQRRINLNDTPENIIELITNQAIKAIVRCYSISLVLAKTIKCGKKIIVGGNTG